MLEINQILCGDSAEVLKSFSDDSIDLVLTSPPYDNLRNYRGYIFDFETIAKEIFRVIKPSGVLVWVVGDQVIDRSESGTSFKQALCFKEIGFKLHDTMIYKKLSGITMNHNRYEQDFEYMFVFTKGKLKTFNGIRIPCITFGDKRNSYYKNSEEINRKIKPNAKRTDIKKDKLKGNIWEYYVGGNHSTRDVIAFHHTAIFPEKLARDHIHTWSNENDVILDPFCGSGTVCKMAYLMNRKYIGIDISREYCDIAEERLKLYTDQGRLEDINSLG